MRFIKINFHIVFITLLSCNQNDDTNQFHYNVFGKGQPTIVIEAAMGDDSESWEDIQAKLSHFATVVTYDRLGLGKSQSTTMPRTVANFANDLDEFLTTENISPPYILMGHSLGGFIIRKYQNDHPEKVVGMILVDPLHEYQYEMLMAIKTKADQEKTKSEVQEFYQNQPLGVQNEFKEYHYNCQVMQKLPFAMDLPITIIASLMVNESVTKEERLVKKELFENWKKDAPQIKTIYTTKSGHYIQDTEPELILDAVKSMIKSY